MSEIELVRVFQFTFIIYMYIDMPWMLHFFFYIDICKTIYYMCKALLSRYVLAAIYGVGVLYVLISNAKHETVGVGISVSQIYRFPSLW